MKRSALLMELADALDSLQPDLAKIVTLEQGKPLSEASAEVAGGIRILRHYAGLKLTPTILGERDGLTTKVIREPLGIVAAITPWNFPFSIPVLKIASALTLGNTVILKPSLNTPFSALLIGAISREILPPGVLNVVAGNDHAGDILAQHPLVDAITLTGSIAAGVSVASAAARTMKRLVLELGGNDAAVVLPDAPIERVATHIAGIAFKNAGQICATIKRVYVHESIYEAFAESLTRNAARLRVGDGLSDGTDVGPLQNSTQRDRVERLVADASARGARVTCGGMRWGNAGYFYKPTVLVDIDEQSPLVVEEQFGPALPVIAYRTVDSAVETVNSQRYGLTASIWGSRQDSIDRAVASLKVGTVSVNTHDVQSLDAPFGGRRMSGIGAEFGQDGIFGLTAPKTINYAR
jgi:acyl-CoA reductase-like NAD-dependent aldehyde dehydrogenase